MADHQSQFLHSFGVNSLIQGCEIWLKKTENPSIILSRCSVFRYVEQFRRDLRMWQRDRWTDGQTDGQRK